MVANCLFNYLFQFPYSACADLLACLTPTGTDYSLGDLIYYLYFAMRKLSRREFNLTKISQIVVAVTGPPPYSDWTPSP